MMAHQAMIGPSFVEEISGMLEKKDAHFDKGRLQSLSDGVFSIVMTLLVLNLITSDVLGAKSAHQLHGVLLALWPKIVSYIISFAVAARFWVAQHLLMHKVAVIDLRFMWLNMNFLFWVSLLPFSAAILGEHHQYAMGEIIYGVNMILIFASLSGCWLRAIQDSALIRAELDQRFLRNLRFRLWMAPLVYLLGILISLYSPHLAYLVYVVNAFTAVLMAGVGRWSLPV
jgi:uncharacterized membrane protein